MDKSTRNKIIALVLALVIGVPLGYWYLWPGRVLARVGDIAITRRDVNVKKKLLQAYAKKWPDTSEALTGLLRDALKETVYGNIGGVVTGEEMRAVAAEINKGTLDAELLGKIKTALGGEESDRYKKFYLRPTVVNKNLPNAIFDYIDKQKTDAALREEAEGYLSRALAGEDFALIAPNRYVELPFDPAYYEKLKKAEKRAANPPAPSSPITTTEELQAYLAKREKAASSLSGFVPSAFSPAEVKKLSAVLGGKKKGAIVPQVVELSGVLYVLKVNTIDDGVYGLGVMRVTKPSIYSTYSELKKVVPLEIIDRGLKKQIKT